MPTQSELDRFEEYYVQSKQKTDERITEILRENEDMATKRRLLEHSTKGGKRIRPVLTLLVSDIYDSPYDRAINHAAIVEFIHNASLIADDRFDGDSERRGKPTFHRMLNKVSFGKLGDKASAGASIMGSHGLLALAQNLVKDPDVLNAVGEGTKALIDGFFAEGLPVVNGVFGGGYDKYIEINKAKTGGLFALAAWMPATHVDADEEQEDAARKYGETVGILYQIADDIADDELPSFVKDEAAELEKWYDEAVSHAESMPDSDKDDLLRAAPAWMVQAMFEQEGIAEEVDVSFLPSEG